MLPTIFVVRHKNYFVYVIKMEKTCDWKNMAIIKKIL